MEIYETNKDKNEEKEKEEEKSLLFIIKVIRAFKTL